MDIKFEKCKEKLHNYQNQLENSVATKNMKKNKISTNIKSLNTSRDKKEKKNTKSEEDERKLKAKINCKTEQSKYHPKDHLKF